MKDNNSVATVSGALAEVQQAFNEGQHGFPADTASVTTNFITKLVDGKSFFWPISKPIQGVETWYRKPKVDPETGEATCNEDGSTKIISAVRRAPVGVYRTYEGLEDYKQDKSKAFIAILVFNYDTRKLELLTTTNQALYQSLFDLFKEDPNKDSVYRTGFSINRVPGEKKVIGGRPIQTYNYVVSQTKLQTEIPVAVVEALKGVERLPNLELLLENIDPFTGVEIDQE